MGMNTSKQRGALSEINVTPLVDVMLVLLIVFMVTTPIIVNETMQKNDLNLPATSGEPVEPGEIQHIVRIERGAEYDIVTLDMGQGPSTLAECSPKDDTDHEECLKDVAGKVQNNQRLKDKQLFLMSDKNVSHGLVIAVMARLKRGGLTQVAMVTNPDAMDIQ